MQLKQVFIFLALLVGPCFATDNQSCEDELLYATDDVESLRDTIENRREFYTEQLRSQWNHLPAFFKDVDGEEVLTIGGLEVMRGFEKPYMKEIARTASSVGGRVLNVGFGLGHIDEYIEQHREEMGITEHFVVELNHEVLNRAQTWRQSHPHKKSIFLRQGDWKAVLRQFKEEGIVFDAIAYDAFPLEVQELHRDFVPFIEEVIRLQLLKEQSGVMTFYLDSKDGLGSRFTSHLHSLGVTKVSTTKVEVTLPSSDTQYWNTPYFFTPLLTGVRY